MKLGRAFERFITVMLCLSMFFITSVPCRVAADQSYHQIAFSQPVPIGEVLAKAGTDGLHILRVWTVLGDAQGCTVIPDNIQGIQMIHQYVTDHVTRLLQETMASLQQDAAADTSTARTSANNSVEDGERVLEAIGRNGLSVIALDVENEVASDLQQDFHSARISSIPCGSIIPSPQLTGQTTANALQQVPVVSSAASYPEDSTWLPSHGSVDVHTLSSGDRFAMQHVSWNDNARMSFFHNNWNSTYEQDTVFSNTQYVSTASNTVVSWISNFPGNYLDSRLFDSGASTNVGVGCGYGQNLVINTVYYYSLELLPGAASQGNELQVDFQPGHYIGAPSGLTVFSYKTYVEFQFNHVPGSYIWQH